MAVVFNKDYRDKAGRLGREGPLAENRKIMVDGHSACHGDVEKQSHLVYSS